MLDPREAVLQVMDPGVGLAPALPYSLGLSSPSRHQQREVEGCSMCPDGAIFWGARHVPRPLLLPGFGAGEGVSGTVSVAVSISFACARGGAMGGVISSVTGR